MQKSSRFAGLVVLLMGCLSLVAALSQPRIHMLHGADIVRLTGCGACLGVGIIGLFGRLRLPEK
jgi:hypothetical protein